MTPYHVDIEKQNRDNAKNAYFKISLGLCLFLLATTFAQVVILDIIHWLELDFLPEGVLNLIILDAPMYGVAVWVFLFSVKKIEAVKPSKSNFGIKDYIAVFPICVFLMLICAYLGDIADSFAQNISGVESESSLTQVTSAMSLRVKIIYLVVIAPIGEEFIFRKLILDRTAKYGEGTAILFSALSFSLFHGNINQMFYAFAVGLVLAYMYVRTGNFVSIVSVHAAMNALFGILMPLCSEESAVYTAIVKNIIVYFTVFGFFMLLFYIARKKVYLQKSEYTLEENAMSCAFANLPFSVFAFIMLFSVISSYM